MLAEGRWPLHKIGDLIRESRIKGGNGSSARKLTVRLYGRGIVSSADRGGSEATNYFVRRAGQFVYSKLDCLNGAFGIVPEHLDGYETTLDLPAFDIIDHVNPDWFLKTVARPTFYGRFKFAAIGSRKANRVPTNEFLATRLSVPPFAEQRAIATVLGTLEETALKSEAVINQMRQSAFSVLSECLSALDEEVASANVGALLREGPKSGFSPMSKDDPPGIGVLKLSAVSRGRLAWMGNTKFADIPERAARQFQIEPGDFLVVRGSGSREIVGSGCRVTEETLPEFDCIFPDLIIRLRADHTKVVPEYLATLWNTNIVRDQIRRVAKSTNGIYKINQTDIRKIRIPLPSIDVQTSIASLIDCIYERVFAEESVLNGLLSTRAALAQELLSGRLRLPESLVARFSDTSAAAA